MSETGVGEVHPRRLLKIFPPTQSVLLRATASIMAGLWLAYGLGMLSLVSGKGFVGALIGLLAIAIAAGIWRLRSWARTANSVGFWFYVLGIHAVMLNPHRAATDGISYDSPLVVYPVIGAGLVALHIFGRHRREFRKP